ncbi:hypothetical protein R1flu_023900 [Riccia fluitans]|uniref:Transposase n=1 Tax=Riccia fluitans TaxID=41844 RepID=A0ABD1XXF5_9MARC
MDYEEEDDFILEFFQLQQQMLVMIATTIVENHFFGELHKEDQKFVDFTLRVRPVLQRAMGTASLFKVLTNFKITEFEELCSRICPILNSTAKTTGEFVKTGAGRPPKLTAQERVLSCMMYLKHDNSVVYEAFQWNWSKSSMSDDALYVCSVINEYLADEIRWPSHEERIALGERLPTFPGCMGHIDGTLCRIRRPWNDENGPRK